MLGGTWVTAPPPGLPAGLLWLLGSLGDWEDGSRVLSLPTDECTQDPNVQLPYSPTWRCHCTCNQG